MRRRDGGFSAQVIRANMAKQGRTVPRVYELCIIRVGAVKAGMLCMDLYWWARAVEAHGEEASGEELAAVAACSRSQGFRKLQQLREIFPGDELQTITAECVRAMREVKARLESGEEGADAGAAFIGGLEVAL